MGGEEKNGVKTRSERHGSVPAQFTFLGEGRTPFSFRALTVSNLAVLLEKVSLLAFLATSQILLNTCLNCFLTLTIWYYAYVLYD